MASQFYGFKNFFMALENWGLMDVLLPFLLVFAVVFAILQKTKIFGERKNIDAILALVFGLIVVVPHVTGVYPAGYDVVEIMNAALPSVSLVIIGIVMLLILIGIFGGEATMFGIAAPGWIAVISIATIIFIFVGAAQKWTGYLWFEQFFTQDAVAIIVMLLVFGIIISFITSADTKEDIGTMRRFGFDFNKIFGGDKK